MVTKTVAMDRMRKIVQKTKKSVEMPSFSAPPVKNAFLVSCYVQVKLSVRTSLMKLTVLANKWSVTWLKDNWSVMKLVQTLPALL